MNCSRLLTALLTSLTLCAATTALANAPDDAVPTASPADAPPGVTVVGTPEKSTTATEQSWYGKAWDTAGTHLSDIWEKGDYGLMVPFWTYHMPFAYSAEKRAQYTEHPWGGGISKGWYNASDNWEGVYLMAYQDSHGKPMYMGGYGWVPTWRPIDDKFKLGAGLTAFMFMRSDIGNYAPIPGLLPVGSIGYGPVDVQVAYVPGGQGNGNVLFWWARVTF